MKWSGTSHERECLVIPAHRHTDTSELKSPLMWSKRSLVWIVTQDAIVLFWTQLQINLLGKFYEMRLKSNDV